MKKNGKKTTNIEQVRRRIQIHGIIKETALNCVKKICFLK